MNAWSLRPTVPGDREFLYRVYAGTRLEELAQLGWQPQQQEGFLHMQFEAQDRHYHEHFPAAEFNVLRAGDADAGRLYLDRGPDEILVLDIALLPLFRRCGLGSSILRWVLQEARQSGLTVALHVECNNPALQLYLRLGFEEVDEHGIYKLLRHGCTSAAESPRPDDVPMSVGTGASPVRAASCFAELGGLS